ncbi:radical SAM protein [Candidatus Binatia bacterium]|nr:radical SAM protein [Candidatus Binatia bacterium]
MSRTRQRLSSPEHAAALGGVATEPTRAGEAAFPARISVEVTNHCNQRCVLCPRQAFTRPLGFLDPALFERIARECAPHGTRLWLHFLGEPLLHRGLVQMIARAKEIGVREVGLSTNALSLHGRLADALLDSGLDRLECSMDADDAETYRAMRGRDHFEQVSRNVRAFLERKRALGRERPVTSIQFMRTPELLASLERVVGTWRPLLGPRDFVMTIEPASFGGAIAVAGAAREERPPCRWLTSSLMILQDGTITMCGADWDAHAPLGNLRETTIAEIWHGAELARRRRAHEARRFDEVAPCATCTDWRLADGSGYRNATPR